MYCILTDRNTIAQNAVLLFLRTRVPILYSNINDAAATINDNNLTENKLYPKILINPICNKWNSVFIAWGYRGIRSKNVSVESNPPCIIDLVSPDNHDSSECINGNLVKKNRFTTNQPATYQYTPLIPDKNLLTLSIPLLYQTNRREAQGCSAI